MTWLGYKVTLFYAGESVSGIAYNETDALITANQQVPTGTVLTGRRTERVPLNDKEQSRMVDDTGFCYLGIVKHTDIQGETEWVPFSDIDCTCQFAGDNYHVHAESCATRRD
jgi:hypothetical protein